MVIDQEATSDSFVDEHEIGHWSDENIDNIELNDDEIIELVIRGYGGLQEELIEELIHIPDILPIAEAITALKNILLLLPLLLQFL